MSINRKTRNIALTIEQDNFIADLVDSGQYQSASEVVRAGLRLLDHDIERHRAEIDQIRKSINASVQAIKEGRYTEGTPEEVIGSIFEEALKEINE